MKKGRKTMKTQNSSRSKESICRHAFAATVALGALLSPGLALADEAKLPEVATLGEDKYRGAAASHEDKSGWRLNFTPVLLMPEGDHRLGGGVDPELNYTVDRGGVRLGAGLRVGGYYAKNQLGITTMPTVRLMVPVGPVEPYVSFGMGYGWLPEIEHAGIATMSRMGVVFRFSPSFGLGVEGTIQKIDGSDWAFPSFGSAVAINF
jgi:hypothetical protein